MTVPVFLKYMLKWTKLIAFLNDSYISFLYSSAPSSLLSWSCNSPEYKSIRFNFKLIFLICQNCSISDASWRAFQSIYRPHHQWILIHFHSLYFRLSAIVSSNPSKDCFPLLLFLIPIFICGHVVPSPASRLETCLPFHAWELTIHDTCFS